MRILSHGSIGALLAALVSAASVLAQNPPQPGQNVLNVFVPADRSLRQHLVRASKAIEEERFSDAVAELGQVLAPTANDPIAGEEPQDFFLDAATQAGSRTSLKTEALRLLGTLPPRGRELYELQFGAAARALLDEAIRESSLEKLHEVTRRYFHTKAGGEATLLLGRLYLDTGRPLAAALLLKQLAVLPGVANQHEPELSVLLAACWYQANQPEKAKEVLQTLSTRHRDAVLRIGQSDAERLPNADQALAWLDRHFGTVGSKVERKSEWALFRGDVSRTAESSGGMPLEGIRWQVPVASYEQDQRLIEEIRQNYIEQGVAMLPGLQPLAIGNVVLMRSPEQLIAIDFETGKRVWYYPWWDVPQPDEPREFTQSPGNEREIRKLKLTQRLWQDAPYGQVSSDGEFVYLLLFDNTEQISPIMPRGLQLRIRGGMQFPNSEFGMANNQLVSLELKREGALHWKVGGETGMDEPQLAGAFFLGPPLPLFGNLFVLAELRGEVRLVVLDAETGRQQWSQQLAHLEPYWQLDSTLRRLAGATPSFADGVLVCPTSSGAVVGVEVATRRLLWGFQYPQSALAAGNMGMSFPGPFPAAGSRWIDSTVTIADGCVILTPSEADYLICLDLLTGQPRWKPLERKGDLAEMMYVACIHDGKIVLAGKDRMVAVKLADGALAWNQSVLLDQDKGEMISGRGFMSGSSYFVPTTASQLVEIDLGAGKIAARARTDHVLGNLICFKDDVISLGPDRATTSYQLEPLRRRVQEKIAANANDSWALARQGELLVHDGKHGEALVALRKANELAPRDEGVRALLVETFLTALRQDFSGHRGLATDIEPLIESGPQRIEYLLMLGDGSQRLGDQLTAADSFTKLARLAGAAYGDDIASAFSVIEPSSSWHVRLDRYVHRRLEELYESGREDVRKYVNDYVAEMSAAAIDPGSPQLARFIQLCGFHPATQEHRLKRATQLLESGKLLEADEQIRSVEQSSDPNLVGVATALRARFASQVNDVQNSAATYEKLRAVWGEKVVFEGKTGQQLYDEAVASGVLKTQDPLDDWPWGKTVVDESNEAFNRQGFRRVTSIPVTMLDEPDQPGMRLVFDTSTSTVEIRDSRGSTVARLSQIDASYGYQIGVSRAEVDGNVLFLNLSGQLMAMPLMRSRRGTDDMILWKESLLPIPAESSAQIARQVPRRLTTPFDPQQREVMGFQDALHRAVAVTGPMTRVGVCYQKIRTLTCIDPLTGKTLWSRQDVEPGLELFGDEKFVFALPPGSHEAIVLDAFDGRLIGKRKLPERRWATVGGKVLAWEESATGYRLFLHDVEAQKDIWSEDLGKDSRGCVIDQHWLGMLRADGRFFLRSLASDRVMIDTKLEVESPVDSIRVRLSSDACLLVVNDKQSAIAPDTVRATSASQFSSTPVNGRIFAFDRRDGSALWQSPAIVRGYYLLNEQPDDLPTLWLVKNYRQGQSNQGPTTRMDLLCLDRRTGAMLLERKSVPAQNTSVEVMADHKKRTISLVLPQTTYSIRFTDEARPPEPPIQHSAQTTLNSAALERFGQIIESVTGAILDAK